MSVAASHPHHDAHSPERTARRPSAAMRVAGSAAGLNTLFQLLHRIDVEGLAGKLVVRRGAKFVAGAWRTRAGQVCAAATVQGRTLLAEQLVAECSMPPAQALQTAEAALSSSGGLSRGGLAAAAGLDAAAGRRVALAFTARECLQTALFCGADSPEIVRLGEADATESWAFDGLELFTAAAAGLDTFAPDAASTIYRECAAKADAALLLLRPTSDDQLPVPIASQGFEATPISDLVPICRGAMEMTRPDAFRVAGLHPALWIGSLDDDSWIATTGEHRLALLRVHGRAAAARVVASAMSRLRGAPS